MIYQAYIALPKESALEAIRRLFNGNSPPFLSNIVSGSIAYEQGEGQSLLELKLEGAEGTSPVSVKMTVITNGNPEETSTGYKLLMGIYQIMRARHGEAIIPMGTIGPNGQLVVYNIGRSYISLN